MCIRDRHCPGVKTWTLEVGFAGRADSSWLARTLTHSSVAVGVKPNSTFGTYYQSLTPSCKKLPKMYIIISNIKKMYVCMHICVCISFFNLSYIFVAYFLCVYMYRIYAIHHTYNTVKYNTIQYISFLQSWSGLLSCNQWAFLS